MSTLPRNQMDLLQFLETHGPQWRDHAAELGLDAAEAQAVIDAYEEAQARYNEARIAQDAAMSATSRADLALRKAHEAAAAAVRIIKNTAIVTNNDNIYATARIDAPRTARPGTLAPPARPVDLRATIASDGAVNLSWSCTHPANSKGVVYIVRRKLAGQAAFTTLATVGEKRFIDRTLTAEALAAGGAVLYTVQAQRGGSAGPVSALLSVQFGVLGRKGSDAHRLAA